MNNKVKALLNSRLAIGLNIMVFGFMGLYCLMAWFEPLIWVKGESLKATLSTFERQPNTVVYKTVFPASNPPHLVRVVKRIACRAGDSFKADGKDLWCNQKKLEAQVNPEVLNKYSIHPFVFQGKIPVGCVFPLGDHDRSYDGRYVGFVCNDQIEGLGHVLF